MTVSEDAFAFNKQANRLAQKGQIQEAFEAYKRALEHDPGFIEAWGNLGILLTRTGQMEEAKGCFDAAFALDPEYAFTWGAWAGYLVIQDRMKEAEQALQKALQLDPDNPKVWAIFGMLFMDSDSKQAEDAFRHALEIDPDNEKLVYGYGIVLNYAGRHKEAEELAHRAVEANKDYADAWELLAQARYCQSNLKGAINAQLAAAKLKETNVTVTFTDDPILMYSIDVTLYKPGATYTFEEEELMYSWTIDLVGTGRVESVDVVLGTGTSYSVFVRTGISIDTTITYGNGAILDNREFLYSCNGTLEFNFGENVNFTGGGLMADIGRPSLANRPDPLSLNIDLPEGMDGRIDFGNDPVAFTQMAGWHHEGFGIYSTASWPFENPSLRMSVIYGSCLADLHD